MTGELALFLNSDACATAGALRALVSVMDSSPDVVACGGMLVGPDGRLQESCASALTLWAVFCEQTLLEKVFPASPVLSPYWMSRRLLSTVGGVSGSDGMTYAGASQAASFDVEQVMGACLCVRPVERFDERFFLYFEDTELCRRLRRHGRIVYVPSAVFRHELGASSEARWQAVARYNRGKELYFALHHDRFASFVCLVSDRMGALLRLVAWSLAAVVSLCSWAVARRRVGLFFRVLISPVAGPELPMDALTPS
jgi:GT2 family glycosyltransferase